MHIVLMLLLISLLILVTEIGHFLAALLCGVRVSRFAIGMPFGPTLFRKKIGHTEFLIHAFFVGGYVAFPDDTEVENEAKDTDDTEEKLPLDSPERFRNKAPWQQAFVIASGVVANIVFALFLVFATALYYHKLPSGTAELYIKEIAQSASAIVKKEIKPNDRILSVNGIKIDSYNKFIFMVQKSKFFDGRADEKIINKKLGQLKELNQKYGEEELIPAGHTVFLPSATAEDPLIVNNDTAAGYEKYKTNEVKLTPKESSIRAEAWEKPSLTLKEPASLREIATGISDSYKPIDITILRDGKEIELRGIYTNKDGLLGVALDMKEIFVETKDVKSAAIASGKYICEKTPLIVLGYWQLISGKLSFQDMHGIVAITKIGGDIIEHHGLLNGLLLTALISINLAVINLLPIPAVDGGHLMFLFLEKIRGRKFDEKTLEKINSFFFMALLVLMVLIICNDIFALITKKF